ncbi:MAG: hypothetical protein ACXVBU_16980, partial [Ktedonobacteraceae bacterium]
KSNYQTLHVLHAAPKVVAVEDAAPAGVVPVVALVAVVLKVEDVDPVVLGSKKHQVQISSRIDDRIG